MATFQTTSPACRLADQSLVWVAYRNGRMLLRQDGKPVIGSAAALAAIGRMDASR